jgi:hypothetical protein
MLVATASPPRGDRLPRLFGLERLQGYRDRVEVLSEEADLALPATEPPGPSPIFRVPVPVRALPRKVG